MLLLAAAGLLSFATPAARIDRLVAASICHSDGGVTAPAGAPNQRRVPECAACLMCQTIAHTGVLPGAPALSVAAPTPMAARTPAPRAADAPPGRSASAASARGPPLPL
jgi:hypothetical protein